MAAQGRDIKLSAQRVEGYRNFATKLWNAARFAEMNGCAHDAGFRSAPRQGDAQPLDRARDREGGAARSRRRSKPTSSTMRRARVYRFVWNVYCDWYLELIKPVLHRPRRRRQDRDARDGGLGARRNPQAAASVHAVHHRGAVARHRRAGAERAPHAGARRLAGARRPRRRGGRSRDRLGDRSRHRDPLGARRDEHSGRRRMLPLVLAGASAANRKRGRGAGRNSSSAWRASPTFPLPTRRRKARCSLSCAARSRRCRSRA